MFRVVRHGRTFYPITDADPEDVAFLVEPEIDFYEIAGPAIDNGGVHDRVGDEFAHADLRIVGIETQISAEVLEHRPNRACHKIFARV